MMNPGEATLGNVFVRKSSFGVRHSIFLGELSSGVPERSGGSEERRISSGPFGIA